MLAGQRLVVPSLAPVAGAEVIVGLGLSGQVTHPAGDPEGDLVGLRPLPPMAAYPEEPEQRLRELDDSTG